MPNLLELLDRVDPNWRENVSANPIDAALELCIIEADELDDYRELNFNETIR